MKWCTVKNVPIDGNDLLKNSKDCRSCVFLLNTAQSVQSNQPFSELTLFGNNSVVSQSLVFLAATL